MGDFYDNSGEVLLAKLSRTLSLKVCVAYFSHCCGLVMDALLIRKSQRAPGGMERLEKVGLGSGDGISHFHGAAGED